MLNRKPRLSELKQGELPAVRPARKAAVILAVMSAAMAVPLALTPAWPTAVVLGCITVSVVVALTDTHRSVDLLIISVVSYTMICVGLAGVVAGLSLIFMSRMHAGLTILLAAIILPVACLAFMRWLRRLASS